MVNGNRIKWYHMIPYLGQNKDPSCSLFLSLPIFKFAIVTMFRPIHFRRRLDQLGHHMVEVCYIVSNLCQWYLDPRETNKSNDLSHCGKRRHLRGRITLVHHALSEWNCMWQHGIESSDRETNVNSKCRPLPVEYTGKGWGRERALSVGSCYYSSCCF